MTRASIPVDLKNPGHVLACMGFLEAAEVLCGAVQAHFEWSEPPARFDLSAGGDKNPFEVVLEFLAAATVVELTPLSYVEGATPAGEDDDEAETAPTDPEGEPCGESDAVESSASDVQGRVTSPVFPAGQGDRNSLPIQLVCAGQRLAVSHWAEKRSGSGRPWLSRNDFKLYSGNRSARRIAEQLLGRFREIWNVDAKAHIVNPFEKTVPLGGSFNFDARRAWTGIDAGFSPDQQKKNKTIAGVAGSPVVELLAAIGLEHTRPDEYEPRKVCYAVWGDPLPAMLARTALSGADMKMPMRRFEFALSGTKQQKIVTFAQEETQR